MSLDFETDIKEKERMKKKLKESIKETSQFNIEVLKLFYEYLELLDKLQDALIKNLSELNSEVKRHTTLLEQHSKLLEEHSRLLEEHSRLLRDLRDEISSLRRDVDELKITIGSFTRRAGLDLEKMIKNLYRKHLVEKGIRDVDKIEKFDYIDVDGRYIGKGRRIEIDLFMSDNTLYLIEVKSLIEREDVEMFDLKCSIAPEVLKKEKGYKFTNVRKIMVGINVTEEALNRANELGVEIIYGSIIS